VVLVGFPTDLERILRHRSKLTEQPHPSAWGSAAALDTIPRQDIMQTKQPSVLMAAVVGEFKITPCSVIL
jgi:hypothetical protein